MHLRWSPEALDDLQNVVEYIALDNQEAARRVSSLILRKIRLLADYPYAGRTGRVADTRELFFPPLPYLAVYRIRNEAVEIGRILHGAQRWPTAH